MVASSEWCSTVAGRGRPRGAGVVYFSSRARRRGDAVLATARANVNVRYVSLMNRQLPSHSHTAGTRACPRTSPDPRRLKVKPRREHEPLRERYYSWTGAKAGARPVSSRLKPACIAAHLRGWARRSASRLFAASQRRRARCATAGTNRAASAASAHRQSRRSHHRLPSIGCVQEPQAPRGISRHHSRRRSRTQQRTLAMAHLELCPGLRCDSESTLCGVLEEGAAPSAGGLRQHRKCFCVRAACVARARALP